MLNIVNAEMTFIILN